MTDSRPTVAQFLPAMDAGGVERGTLEIAAALTSRGFRSIVVSAGGRMEGALADVGSEHLCWPLGEKSLFTLRHIPVLRAWLRRERPDILHLRSRLPAWVVWLAWRGLPADVRPRLVTTFHGLYGSRRYSRIMLAGERVIAVSDAVRSYIAQRYPDTDMGRIRVIHRGVDRAQYAPGWQPSAAWKNAFLGDYPGLRDAWVVTLPGRMTRLKGHAAFVDIIGGLKAAGVPVKGVIAGGAEAGKQAYRDEIEAKILRCGLQDDIVLTGHRDDLKAVLAISAAVLSLSEKPESFGRTTLEALSLGRPVLGWNHGGVAEQLAELLPAGAIAPGDVAGATARLVEWYGAPVTVPEQHRFTLQNMQDQTLALYEELLKH